MTLGDILGIIAIVVLALWTLCSTTVLTLTFVGDRVIAGTHVLLRYTKAIAMRGIGLLAATVLAVIVFRSASHPIEKLIAGLILIGFGVMLLYGMSVVTSVVAGRLYRSEGPSPSTRALFNSSFLCILASLAPVVGWFIIAPLLISFGLGISSTLLWPIVSKNSTKDVSVISDERALS